MDSSTQHHSYINQRSPGAASPKRPNGRCSEFHLPPRSKMLLQVSHLPGIYNTFHANIHIFSCGHSRSPALPITSFWNPGIYQCTKGRVFASSPHATLHGAGCCSDGEARFRHHVLCGKLQLHLGFRSQHLCFPLSLGPGVLAGYRYAASGLGCLPSSPSGSFPIHVPAPDHCLWLGLGTEAHQGPFKKLVKTQDGWYCIIKLHFCQCRQNHHNALDMSASP